MLKRLAIAAALLLSAALPAAAALTPDEVAQLAPVLAEAEAHGLAEPGDAALAQELADPRAHADAAARLERRVVAYALAQRAGRFDPDYIDELWDYQPVLFDAAGALAAARAEGRLAAWTAELPRPEPAYQALVAARARYAAVVRSGGWTPILGRLGPRAQGDEVAMLRARLAAEGYASADARPDLFGPSLTAALKAWQTAHGLTADGLVGPATLEALNVPADQRLLQIDLALERWRWLPRPLPVRRVEVNVAAAEAVVIDGAAEALRMRVVVGDLDHKTPIFQSVIHSIVVNPPWTVPDSIAQAEILPQSGGDPAWLARNGYAYVDGQLQQAPGPGNALGRLKFDFENPYNVYLHDTPSRATFNSPNRVESHGCIRLEKPKELAALLLGWSLEQVDAAIAAGATTRVPLEVEIPVVIFYQTAWAQPDGTVAFRPDVYGWDAKLAAVLGPEPAGVTEEAEAADATEAETSSPPAQPGR